MRRLHLIHTAALAAFIVAGCSGTSNTTSTTAADTAQPAPAKPVETFHEVTIPADTAFAVSLDTGVSSATSHVDDPVRAHLTKPVTVDGFVALAPGSEISGAVVDAEASQRVKGRAELAVRFDTIRPVESGESYTIRTAAVSRQAAGQMKKDATKVGIGAGIGAGVGALLGGGKGAAIGAGVGGGGGAAYVMSQKGPEVSLGRGAALTVRLIDAIKVRVRTAPQEAAAKAAN